MKRGRIENVQAVLQGSRMKVVLSVSEGSDAGQTAFLPDREISALLPRSILLPSLREVPRELLDTIDPMLRRLLKGRIVRLWEYSDRRYASFLSWRSVHFADP